MIIPCSCQILQSKPIMFPPVSVTQPHNRSWDGVFAVDRRLGTGSKKLTEPDAFAARLYLWGLRRTINSAFDASNDVHVDICRVCPLGQGITQLFKVALDLPFKPIESCSATLSQQQDVIKHLEDLVARLVNHCCDGHPHMCYLYMHQQKTRIKPKAEAQVCKAAGCKEANT